jgi:hypothetical protein
MAGSLKHCLTDDNHYRGITHLDHMGDAEEAIEEMVFIILTIRNRWSGDRIIIDAINEYYKCLRGEQPWPEFMNKEETA